MTTITYPVILRIFYAGLWLLLLPLAVLHLLYRSIRQPAYREFIGERFGQYNASPANPIWLHAASLGEVNAAATLLNDLRTDYPAIPLLITCQTPAGRQRALALKLDNCLCVYCPFDVAWATRRFIRHFQPRLALIVETEIWPNLYLSARKANVPLLIVNARMSERSFKRYSRLQYIFTQTLALVNGIACQTAADAQRFIALGANSTNVSISGNIKWDIRSSDAAIASALQRRSQWPQRPIWLAASTHADEEPVVLAAHAEILQQWPNALLLWAPRHIERFTAVTDLLTAQGLRVSILSADVEPTAHAQVFLIDTLGELQRFMPCADMVFVGGSLQNIGGHNVLEPAALGLPIIVGPHTQHFAEIIAELKNASALLEVSDAAALTVQLVHLLATPNEVLQLGQNALRCIQKNAGALEKTKALVAQRL
jgi:3-deoxy-D-manno-octulosonic-acid transferase